METSEIRPEIENVVRQCVADSLALDVALVRLESRLTDELGADSLDFVDILFTLEKKLDVKLRDTEFNFLTRLDYSSPKVMRDGHLTMETIERMRPWLPALESVPDRTRVTPRELFSLVTIESICLIVENAIGRGLEA